jgi:hypothetical protein
MSMDNNLVKFYTIMSMDNNLVKIYTIMSMDNNLVKFYTIMPYRVTLSVNGTKLTMPVVLYGPNIRGLRRHE